MKYDKQYYLLCESGHAGFHMLGQAEDSDEGLEHLMATRSWNTSLAPGPALVQVLLVLRLPEV